MDSAIIQEILEELGSALQRAEASGAAVLELVKEKGIAKDDELAPYLERANAASSIRLRATRVRLEYLLSGLEKRELQKEEENHQKQRERKREETSEPHTQAKEQREDKQHEGERSRAADEQRLKEQKRPEEETKENDRQRDPGKAGEAKGAVTPETSDQATQTRKTAASSEDKAQRSRESQKPEAGVASENKAQESQPGEQRQSKTDVANAAKESPKETTRRDAA